MTNSRHLTYYFGLPGIAFSLCLFMGCARKATPETHLQTAKEFVELTRSKEFVEARVKAALSAEQNKTDSIMKKYPKEFSQWLTTVLSDPENIELEAKVYIRYFSEQELRELISFYKTPVGKKLSILSGEIYNEEGKSGGILAKKHEKELTDLLLNHK